MNYQFKVTVEIPRSPLVNERTFKFISRADAEAVFSYAEQQGLAARLSPIHLDTVDTALLAIDDEIAQSKEHNISYFGGVPIMPTA